MAKNSNRTTKGVVSKSTFVIEGYAGTRDTVFTKFKDFSKAVRKLKKAKKPASAFIQYPSGIREFRSDF